VVECGLAAHLVQAAVVVGTGGCLGRQQHRAGRLRRERVDLVKLPRRAAEQREPRRRRRLVVRRADQPRWQAVERPHRGHVRREAGRGVVERRRVLLAGGHRVRQIQMLAGLPRGARRRTRGAAAAAATMHRHGHCLVRGLFHHGGGGRGRAIHGCCYLALAKHRREEATGVVVLGQQPRAQRQLLCDGAAGRRREEGGPARLRATARSLALLGCDGLLDAVEPQRSDRLLLLLLPPGGLGGRAGLLPLRVVLVGDAPARDAGAQLEVRHARRGVQELAATLRQQRRDDLQVRPDEARRQRVIAHEEQRHASADRSQRPSLRLGRRLAPAVAVACWG
jgi:hypothetical protein